MFQVKVVQSKLIEYEYFAVKRLVQGFLNNITTVKSIKLWLNLLNPWVIPLKPTQTMANYCFPIKVVM